MHYRWKLRRELWLYCMKFHARIQFRLTCFVNDNAIIVNWIRFLQNVFSFFPSSQSATISPIFIGFYVEKFDKWLKIKYCSKKNSRFFILSDKHWLGQTETKFTVNDIKTVSVFVFDCTAICLIALSSGLTILLPK